MWIALASIAVAAPCPEALPAAEVMLRFEAAAARLEDPEEEGFLVALARAREALPCVDGVLESSAVARIHQLHGVEAALMGNDEDAARAFAAARAADPAIAPPPARAGLDLQPLLRRQALDTSPTVLLDVPRGAVWIDGHATQARALDRPVIVQVVDGRRVLQTEGLAVGEPWVAAGAPAETSKTPGWVVAGALASASGVLALTGGEGPGWRAATWSTLGGAAGVAVAMVAF